LASTGSFGRVTAGGNIHGTSVVATNLYGTLATAAQTNITSVGTIGTGVWQGTDVGVAYGGTGASSLNNLITLGTHTTGNYISTITPGSGIYLDGASSATSAETATPTLTVDSGSLIAYYSSSMSRLSVGTTTAAPNMELTVEGDISASGDFYIKQGNLDIRGLDGKKILSSSGQPDEQTLKVWLGDIEGEGNETYVKVDDSIGILMSGNVGINNINPTHPFVVTGNISASGDLFIKDSAYLATDGGTEKVGIGTLTPTKALTVEGDISSSGGFFVSSSGNVMVNADTTGSMVTHLGAFSVNYGNGTQLTGSLQVAGNGYGDIVKIGGAVGMTRGNCYYMRTNGSWSPANATDNSTGANEMLAIALGTNSDIDGMLLRGFVNAAPAGTERIGTAIYLRAIDGGTTYDVPSTSANIVRIVGYGLGSDIIYFNPDSTWVTIA